ncbi:hypothetical protein MRQ36_28250 [Micromonospora sp. R77]|uniref:hypothetical protein n=1 Tax=Micromonospora sp. R77 TaxID=2925836 RepID=UPI001F611105|nr:hypothetical protein [Micromonospora sp. R77]MCI4066231.1 hypothetical protein [Micromonospora sp. R77]
MAAHEAVRELSAGGVCCFLAGGHQAGVIEVETLDLTGTQRSDELLRQGALLVELFVSRIGSTSRAGDLVPPRPSMALAVIGYLTTTCDG